MPSEEMEWEITEVNEETGQTLTYRADESWGTSRGFFTLKWTECNDEDYHPYCIERGYQIQIPMTQCIMDGCYIEIKKDDPLGICERCLNRLKG